MQIYARERAVCLRREKHGRGKSGEGAAVADVAAIGRTDERRRRSQSDCTVGSDCRSGSKVNTAWGDPSLLSSFFSRLFKQLEPLSGASVAIPF